MHTSESEKYILDKKEKLLDMVERNEERCEESHEERCEEPHEEIQKERRHEER